MEESGDLFSLVLRTFTSKKGGGYEEADSRSTERIRTRVSRGCWSAWPDRKGRRRAPPAPAGSGRAPERREPAGGGQVGKGIETSGGRWIRDLPVLFCDAVFL